MQNPLFYFNRNVDLMCSTVETWNNTNVILSNISAIHPLNQVGLIEELFEIFALKNKRYNSHALTTINVIINNSNSWMTPHISDMLCSILKNAIRNQKEYVYSAYKTLILKAPSQITVCMPTIIGIIANDVNDINGAVKTNATDALNLLLKCSGNNDLNVFIPDILKGLKNSSTIGDAIESLSSCVFVQNIEAPALSMLAPILSKGLRSLKTSIKRKTCVIIDNMCKLIEHPKEILPFYVQFKTLLEQCSETISDPEARGISCKALNTLKSSCNGNEHLTFHTSPKDFDAIINTPDYQKMIKLYQDHTYALIILSNLCNGICFDENIWNNIFDTYMHIDLSERQKLFNFAKSTFIVKDDIYEDTEEGKNLYQGIFSLAYGSLTLLNNTGLHLKQNRFYGLLGPNNCGKTTLMRAIANEQIEGFPKKDVLKTIFVEHEIQEREVGEDERGFPILNIDLCGVDWVVDCCNHIYDMEIPVIRSQVEIVMEEIGFGNAKKNIGKDRAADMEMGVTTYSGGWKMKMQLCAATLMNADIIMLDEPTGHLDVTNVAWIKSWLNSFMIKGGSIITTSHDSVFLNEMCTHLIDFQNRKLKTVTGSHGKVLQEFVEQFPEKNGYFELKNDNVKFVFPEPGPLEGVKSISKVLLKMKDVTFTYPTRDTPTIKNVCIECSRMSRVGVVGANGAGKSTAIKILIGELKTTQGEVVKHPGMRVAYIAQHAFYHLEKHLNKTPAQYIMWRFTGNEDKEGVDLIRTASESTDKITKYRVVVVTVAELKACETVADEKMAVEPENIISRRTNNREKIKEYEVKWKGHPIENTMWVNRNILLKMGASSMVQRHDEKEAVMAGLISKTLTTKDIEKHFANFGIDPEQASHTLIKSLSGGQKVKIVLAASLWQHPHLIILDEPTNYLDRDGLGALTQAIHDFKGGVVIISHNKEFTSAIVQEKWIMEKGLLRREGESIETAIDNISAIAEQNEIVYDSYGNEIKVERKIMRNARAMKKEIKILQKQLTNKKTSGQLSPNNIDVIETQLEQLQADISNCNCNCKL